MKSMARVVVSSPPRGSTPSFGSGHRPGLFLPATLLALDPCLERFRDEENLSPYPQMRDRTSRHHPINRYLGQTEEPARIFDLPKGFNIFSHKLIILSNIQLSIHP